MTAGWAVPPGAEKRQQAAALHTLPRVAGAFGEGAGSEAGEDAGAPRATATPTVAGAGRL